MKEQMCKVANIDRKFTTHSLRATRATVLHSLRATGATVLFDVGMPESPIHKRTSKNILFCLAVTKLLNSILGSSAML